MSSTSNGVLERYVKDHGPWNKGKKLPHLSGENNSTFKHGMSHTRFNTIWKHMRGRCFNPKNNSFKNYGGRGIKICKRWDNFLNFKSDMYEGYLKHIEIHGEKDTTIERINPNGNYFLENCRWATKLEQSQNRRNVIFATFNGETKTVAEWCKIKGIKYATVRRRIVTMKWSIEDSFNKPLMKNQFC